LGIYLFSTASRPALGPTQPPIECVLGLRRLGREADHSPPKMRGAIYLPQYAFMAWCLVKLSFSLIFLHHLCLHIHLLHMKMN
jgi:hypothetical protein